MRRCALACALLAMAAPLAAQIATPMALEAGVSKYAKQSRGELEAQLEQAQGMRPEEEIFARFSLLRRDAAAGDSRDMAAQSARILAASAACDETSRRTVYSSLGDALSLAGGLPNQRINDLRAQGQLMAAERIREHLEEIQRNQQMQLEYMEHRGQMQRRLTMLLLACLLLLVALAWTLWRIANNRRHQALEDPLTGLKNRRFLPAFMAQESERLRRHGYTALFLMADIDHFKQVNDKFGHEVGDRALVHVATVVRGCMRNSDVVARWGGEEFLIVCPQSSEADAGLICGRIRKRLHDAPFQAAPDQPLRMTLSIGAALYAPAASEEGWEATRERADQAMYRVKENGRDGWWLNESPKPEYAENSAAAS